MSANPAPWRPWWDELDLANGTEVKLESLDLDDVAEMDVDEIEDLEDDDDD